MRTHIHPRAPPSGVPQESDPPLVVPAAVSTFVSETTCTDIKVNRVGIVLLRVQPLRKTLLPLQDDPGRDQRPELRRAAAERSRAA